MGRSMHRMKVPAVLARSRDPRRQVAPQTRRRAEHERRVEPAEPERGRQHPAVAALAALAEEARQERRELGLGRLEVHRPGHPARRGSASAAIAASIAPVAPERMAGQAPSSRLTGTVAARSPSARRDRPRLGDVADRRRRAWALTQSISSRRDAGVRERDA